MAKIVCISDTHNQHDQLTLPPGDILLHSGDFTNLGKIGEIQDFFNWMSSQPYTYKVLICGNHEKEVSERDDLLIPMADSWGLNLIHNKEIEIMGLKFYGEPRSPECGWGWGYSPGQEAEEVWSKIPANIDVLVTHGPPYGIADSVFKRFDSWSAPRWGHLGCPALRRRVEDIKPRLHVCGHIHEGWGIYPQSWGVLVNASIKDEKYYPANKANKPIIINLEPKNV